MSREPRYTKAERVERAKEVEKLRRRAVKSWNADDGTAAKSTALVIMTFEDYLKLVEHEITLRDIRRRLEGR